MHFSQSTFATLAVAAGLVSAAPTLVEKRATGVTDADILNYALTLEHLEDTFYRENLARFDEAAFSAAGFDSEFYNNIQKVSEHEATHVSFLTTALTAAGVDPVAACTYDFGVTDVESFIATASILEGVGVSAYLGAAADIMSKAYLTAAGSILTVESRHSAYIRAGLKQVPFAQPFDAPLSLDEVFSLASAFIVECPSSNPPLPVKAFPSLALGTTGPVMANDTVLLLTPDYILQGPDGTHPAIYAAFISVTGPAFVLAEPVSGGFEVTIPSGFAGQSYVVLTSCNEFVSDDTIAAGPAIIEISG